MAVSLQGMTQDHWNGLTHAEREASRDLSGLSPQLKGWEGWRVEVVSKYGDKRRFIVGRSTGWRPCHLEISRRNARGGTSADHEYESVRGLYRVR